MRTTIFVALGRQSIFKASANAAVTYKPVMNRRDSAIRLVQLVQGTYRFRTVTTATSEEGPQVFPHSADIARKSKVFRYISVILWRVIPERDEAEP